jgi:hypothetical protein
VQTPNGDVFAFSELTEDALKTFDGVHHEVQLSVHQYTFGETVLEYQSESGRLLTFTLGAGPLKIGADRGGPFHGFPMSRAEICEIFGEPDREGRSSKPAFQWK